MSGTEIIPSTLQAEQPWFDYPVRVQPHHTDYSGGVWHGTYLTWMEAARVECLRSLGVDFEELVALGCDLPVVEISIRYHRQLQMGAQALVRARMLEVSGVRIPWEYQIQAPDGQVLYTTAQVTLVAVDREKGKILRRLPATVETALTRLAGKAF